MELEVFYAVMMASGPLDPKNASASFGYLIVTAGATKAPHLLARSFPSSVPSPRSRRLLREQQKSKTNSCWIIHCFCLSLAFWQTPKYRPMRSLQRSPLTSFHRVLSFVINWSGASDQFRRSIKNLSIQAIVLEPIDNFTTPKTC